MPPLFHLTSCTPTKSNLYLANSLAAAVNEPALYRLLTFKVPNLVSLFRCLCRTKLSVRVRGFVCEYFLTKYVLTGRSCYYLAKPPSWRTTPCRLSATAYSIYSQLPSISEAVPPSATWGRAKPWSQGPTYHMARVRTARLFVKLVYLQFKSEAANFQSLTSYSPLTVGKAQTPLSKYWPCYEMDFCG